LVRPKNDSRTSLCERWASANFEARRGVTAVGGSQSFERWGRAQWISERSLVGFVLGAVVFFCEEPDDSRST
jgi:hypothetical protein